MGEGLAGAAGEDRGRPIHGRDEHRGTGAADLPFVTGPAGRRHPQVSIAAGQGQPLRGKDC